MRIYSAEETAERLPYDLLIQQMAELFAQEQTAPPRHHHTLPMHGEADATLLLMPAWSENIGCVKIVTATPGNSKRGLPAIAGSVLVFNRQNGEHLALLDGATLTARRTAAASALAASYLAEENASCLAIIGSGRVARELPEAFSAIRPIDNILLWNIRKAGAQILQKNLVSQGWNANWTADLPTILSQANIISTATLATKPIIKGQWLKAGQHLDLIGAFTPGMREVDDAAINRCQVYIDTQTALQEAGELKIPLATGVLREADICGDLYALCNHKVGRKNIDEITLFKSVGNAIMDLAAATLAIRNL